MRNTSSLRIAIFTLTLAASALVTGTALADVAPPNSGDCRTKSEGNSCKTDGPSSDVAGQAGSCAKQKCTQNDYSQGVPPKQVEVDCLICVASDAGASEAGTAADKVTDKGSATPAPKGETAKSDPIATNAPAPAATTPQDSGSCSVGGTASGFAPLLLAMAVPLILRRRRRS